MLRGPRSVPSLGTAGALGALVVLAGGLLAGCGGSSSAPATAAAPVVATTSAPATTTTPTTPTTPRSSPRQPAASAPATTSGPQYVALGDSYAAAPGLPPSDGDDGCLRSKDDYPHLLAARTAMSLTDVSCSGATTDDLLHGQDVGAGVPPQVGALSSATRLVTLGIGGNDENLFVETVGGCALLARSDPTGSPCTDAGSARARTTLASIRDHIADVLDAVDRRAPRARVVVVGYPRLLPEDGTTCPDLVPLAAGDYAFVNSITRGLSDDLRAEARAHGAGFVDVYAASAGHDVCSGSPWINGQHTASDGVIPFHPFGSEQAGVADLLAAALRAR